MNYVPKSLSRFGHRRILKLQKSSPTILVIGGVVGFGVTAVLAAKASRKIDPIIEDHKKARLDVDMTAVSQRDMQMQLANLYANTSMKFVRLYTPTLVVGTLSTASVLQGHKILQTRHLATMAAYGGLMDQFKSYRARVAETVGSELEREIHAGAIGKYEEDPDHPGEYKQVAKYDKRRVENYLQPFFDESNRNWTTDSTSNLAFLKAVQAHMNRRLNIIGYVFLYEVYEALGWERFPEAMVSGWVMGGDGDNYVDFGFLTEETPEAIMFRNGAERSVRLNFNIDGIIWDKI